MNWPIFLGGGEELNLSLRLGRRHPLPRFLRLFRLPERVLPYTTLDLMSPDPLVAGRDL
jgi:hypothetical protein